MARFLVWLVDGKENNPSGCAPQVLLTLHDPLWGANTWSISKPNSWIGTGSGEYKATSVIDRVLTRLVCFDAGSPRIELMMQRYPSDFSEDNLTTSGGGAYKSPYAPGKTFSLRWYSYGSIRPEPCEETIMDEN